MKIVLATEGSRGDVYPMLALAGILRAAGHEIRLCAPPDFAPDAGERGFDFVPVGIPVRPYLVEKAAALQGSALTFMRETHRYFENSIVEQFRILPDACADADLVVGAGVQIAAAAAAELHRVPFRYVVYCPVLLPSEDHPAPVVRTQSWPRWANRVSWSLFRGVYNQLLGGRINRERHRLALRPVRDVMRYLLTRRPILAADPELAPLPAAPDFEVRRIRCLHPRTGEDLPPKLESFLESGPPPVYVGFGSMTDPDPARTTARILEAVTSLGRRAIISEGWAGLGDAALPEGVLCVGAVSHARLFPRCAAVVHHGGAGTTTTATRAGVPQLVVPHLLDQFYWGHRVWQLGLGTAPIVRSKLTPQVLTESLTAILENELLQDRAAEIGKRLQEPEPPEEDPVRVFTGGS